MLNLKRYEPIESEIGEKAMGIYSDSTLTLWVDVTESYYCSYNQNSDIFEIGDINTLVEFLLSFADEMED